MDKLALAAVVMLALASFSLLAPALTGLAISETCCTGPSCSSEQLCSAAHPELEVPAGLVRSGDGIIAVGFLGLAVALAILLSRRTEWKA